MKISTNWLRDFVDLKPPLERTAERLTLAGLEVKKMSPGADGKDVVFEIEITTNRPDWLSHIGVAREIAAVENLSFKFPEVDKQASRPMSPGWKIDLKESEGCPYYTAVYIEGLREAPTPDFIRERLAACGLRSIGLAVDITNYVLLETGQPLHAFDADRIAGKEIQVRKAKTGEKFTAIDGKVLALTAKDLVIADGEKPVALAGVMGGKDTEVTERTKNVLLESAFFQPRWVRQTAQRHQMASDSSYRFERRVDPAGVDFARERAVALIRKYAQPRFVGGVMKAGQPPAGFRGRIHLTAAEIHKKLGLEIKASQVSLLLTRLGLDVKPESKDGFSVAVPSFRADLTRAIDLIEEVARLHGYDKIPETIPECAPLEFSPDPAERLEDRARQYFAGIGAHETVTFSLISDAGLTDEDLRHAISIVNPQHKELRWLRPTLVTSLLTVVQKNVHAGFRGASFYEIANVYAQGSTPAHPVEERTLGMMLYGEVRTENFIDRARSSTFFDLKGSIRAFLTSLGITEIGYCRSGRSYFEPAVSEEIIVAGGPAGEAGKIHAGLANRWGIETDVFFAQLSLRKILGAVRWIRPVSDWPRYPAVDRDLSVMVRESVKAAEIEEEIFKHGGGLIREIRLFDLFREGRVPKGFKNLSYRVIYQSRDTTLVSEEIQALHQDIARKVAAKFEASFQ